MGFYEDSLNTLRDQAIAFIKARVSSLEHGRYTLDTRLLVKVDVGDVGGVEYNGVEQYAIHSLVWDEEKLDVNIEVVGDEGSLDDPDPLDWSNLDPGDIIALADMLDTEKSYGSGHRKAEA